MSEVRHDRAYADLVRFKTDQFIDWVALDSVQDWLDDDGDEDRSLEAIELRLSVMHRILVALEPPRGVSDVEQDFGALVSAVAREIEEIRQAVAALND